jgi:hypothetical protein
MNLDEADTLLSRKLISYYREAGNYTAMNQNESWHLTAMNQGS